MTIKNQKKMLMREHLISFQFPGLTNISLNNKFDSFGNRLRSKAASFALECMAQFPFFTDYGRYACPCPGLYKDSSSWAMKIRTEFIALNHHVEF